MVSFLGPVTHSFQFYNYTHLEIYFAGCLLVSSFPSFSDPKKSPAAEDTFLVILPIVDLYILSPIAGMSANIDILRLLRLGKLASRHDRNTYLLSWRLVKYPGHLGHFVQFD